VNRYPISPKPQKMNIRELYTSYPLISKCSCINNKYSNKEDKKTGIKSSGFIFHISAYLKAARIWV
jgi:hypothetical protein